jgi:type II secretory pathway predicted ATPase ExeA
VIEPTTAEDTAEYLRYRLKLAGTDKEIFTSDAVTVLHEAALGALRDLDRVATTALRIATRRKRKLVERDVVTDAIALDAPSVP